MTPRAPRLTAAEQRVSTRPSDLIDGGGDITATPRWIAEGQRRVREIRLARAPRM